VSHGSSFLLPPVIAFSPPQPCAAAPQHTWDRSAAATLPYTNLIENHNKICPKAAQEDTIDGSISSTSGLSHCDLAHLPMYHRRTQANSTLSQLSQESKPVASSNIFPAFPSSSHKPFSCQVSLLSFIPHQEIPCGHETPPNRNGVYAVDKDIFKVIHDK
jgi:hypothetical protein